MPGRSTTSSNDNIGLGDYLESVYNGGAAFAGDLRTAIQHPIDTLIIPPLALAYDVAIVGSATMGAAVLSDPQFDLYQSEIAEIRGAVKKDPQIVEDAKARLHARKEMLIEAAEKFVANDGPGRTEMATHLGLNLLTPGYFSKALKAVSNVRKFGTPFNPPRFQYLEKHDFSNLPPIKHLSRSEIRKQHMDGELLYVVKPNGQLLLGDRDYIQALGCDFWGHPELAWPDPIIAAGEVVFSGGKIIKINNMSGHFRPSGPKLKSYVETVFEKNGYSEAPGLFEYIPKSKRLLKSDTMLPSSSLGFGPSPLGMMAGITMTATHGSTPYFNSSFLFGMAYAESMSNPYTKARAQASFPPHSSQNKKHTTTPTTPEEAQQALDDLEKQHLQALLELFGDIVTASETLDISDVKDMQGIQEQYEEIEALKSQQETHGIDPNLTQQIADKTRALKSQIIPEIIKRKKFTENLQYASDTLTGLRRGVGVIDAAWARRAEEVLTVGSSVLTGLEQGAALFGMGIAAASLNPVLAFGTIVGAVGNVLSLFQKKQQQDPGEMQLRIANLFFQRIEQLEKSMLIEFSKLSSQVADMGWHTLAKLTGMAERQHDTLSFLNSISLALNQMRADQSAQLVVHSAMLSEILVNIAGNTYLMNLDQLREELRFITTNSLFPDYNTRTNKLDHLGVQTSYDQPSNLFLLEGTKPASYLQIPSYFARLISPILARENHTVDERAELPSPLPILYAANGKIILGYKQYPEPNASRLRLRIAQREIAQLKIYKTELEKLVALTAQARHPSLVDHFIAAYKVAATTLQTAIVEKTLAIEDLKTNSIHKSRMADLAEVHGKEENRFNAEIGVRAYEWFKGMDRWKSYFRGKHGHRRASNGRYDGVPDSSADYEDLKRRLEYIESQRKHIKNGKENWSIKISEFLRQLADTNHLSTSVLANISIYHGARYLKPTQSGLPYLPAPDPLLPTDHPQLGAMRILQEAQAYGLGSIELFYTTNPEKKIFVIDVVFRQKSRSKSDHEIIVRLKFPYDPLSGYNKAEAIWYEWVGHPDFVPLSEGKQDVKPLACADTFACGERSVSVLVPKPLEERVVKQKERVGKIEVLSQLFQGEHPVLLIVQDDLLTAVNNSLQLSKRRFTEEVREDVNNLLDYMAQNRLGRACHAFEEAYRHLSGVLSFAYFDTRNDPKTPLARWFTSHTVSVEQLRNAPLTRAPQDLLDELINDLPRLKQILSALPTNASHFQLLSNTTANLETFLRIYEPHAVENNNEVPLINFDAEVSRVLAIVSVITAQGMMRGLPLETVSHYLNKTLAKEHPLVVQEAMQLHEEQQNRLFEEMMLLSASPASAEVRKLAAAGADAFQQAHGDSSRDETLGDDGPPNPQDFKVEDDNSAPGFFGLPFARGAKIVPVSPEQKTEAVASAATRSVSLPIWMLPLHIISPVITTSFSGFKSVGSGLLSFVKTSWGQLSDNLAASDSTEMFAVHSFDDTKNDTSDETKKSLSEPTQQQNNFQKPQRLSPPQVDGFALAQVTIPLVSKMCKRHELFGYKLLTPEQITHYRTHYEAQLNLIKASLDEMLKHPILQRQKEVHLAEEALKQAQSRFKNTFKKKPHLNVNRSQQADIDHLVEIAQENLQCAKVVQAKVEQQIPELMDELCESAEMNIAHKFLGEPPPQYPQFGSMYFLAPTRYSAMQPIAQDQEPASVNEGEGSNPLALYLLKTSIKP